MSDLTGPAIVGGWVRPRLGWVHDWAREKVGGEMVSTNYLPVSRRALFQRLQRKVAKDGSKVVRGRGKHAGAWYLITGNGAWPIEPMSYARKVGALADYEVLEPDHA